MARPREFDEEKVLNAAVLSFWQQGYEATSVRTLARAMGLTSASLYNAFGDKRQLFQKALDHYVETGFAARAHRLETELPPREAVVTFFEEMVEISLADPDRKGCFIVNSALEVAPHDPEFQRAIEAVMNDMEGFFLRCVTAAQAEGTVSDRQPPEDIARLLLGLLLGLRVLARTRPEPELLYGALRAVFEILETAPGRGSSSRPKAG